MGVSRPEYWSGLPFPPPGDLSDPGIEPKTPASPALQADSFTAKPAGKPCPPLSLYLYREVSVTQKRNKKPSKKEEMV